ncbi:hypothetical protein BKA66DRAFT_575197 [Pyrenochaeta sp. MPI-SDFR-AT-0127]|nr:hypothetical protein BKA66DRAFT_575197 [Pyrenochaeta sp. MPI-SDFR-AT-0127]
MVDAREAASKLFSKSRWRTKSASNDDGPAPQPKSKPQATPPLNDDLSDFLKPSTDRAQQHKDAAAAAFLNTTAANRPRIDVARAQRWPGAQTILSSAAAGARSPGPGGLSTGTRKKGLTVSFVRTVPEIIGQGGDECEDPSLVVSKHKNKASAAAAATTSTTTTAAHQHPQKPQDDMNLGTRTNGIGRTSSQTEQRNSLTRTLTSHGELSPPLGQKLQIGQINTYANPPPPPPQRLGPMGLGERPRVLSRAPTGFDNQLDPSPRRPSNDSAYSQDSDGSPVLLKKPANMEPTIEEEDNFVPRPLKRSQTGFQDHEKGPVNHDQDPGFAVPPIPRLPEMRLVEQEEDSPIDAKAMLAERYLQSEPAEPNSFSARVKHKMRADEGRALHEAAQRAASGQRRDSDSSSLQSLDPVHVGTPPSSNPPQAVRMSPTQAPPGDFSRTASLRASQPDDPQRSRARGPSPGRRPLPPGSFPADTDAPPQSVRAPPYTGLSTASQPRAPPGASGLPQTMEKSPFSGPSQGAAIQPDAPAQFDQGQAHFSHSQTQPMQPPKPPQASSLYIQSTPTSAGTPTGQLPMRTRQDTGTKPNQPLARSDTRLQGEAAFKDFAERVTHMRGIFKLTAQLGGHMYNFSPMQWLRVATWWFLKGRAGMEALIRSQPKSAEPQPERLTQPHVDLAKVWWILTEVLPSHPGLQSYGNQGPDVQVDLARQAGDAASAEAFEIRNAIMHYMKLLVGSMKKHQSMPPTQALIQGQDQSIWEQYPAFAPDVASVLVAGLPRSNSPQSASQTQFSLSQCIPLADTKTDFCYFRMFVKASLSTDDPNTDRAPMPAVISVLRPKDEYQVKLAICSQTSLMNIVVGSNAENGPTWKDISWKKQSRQISVQLRHGFILTLELGESDWRSLFAIVDHTNRVETDLRERRDERFACKLYLREATYKDSANPSAFPPERVPGCKLMVFQRIDRSSEGTGKRKLHRGYRMVLVTAQKNKQVSLVNHELGTKQEPMNFEYITESDQAPAMRLHFREETPDKKQKTCMVHLVFQEGKDRNLLFGTFTSMNIAEGETAFAQVPLKAFHIESADQAEGFSQQGSRVLEKLQWQEAKVVNQDPEAAGLEAAPTVMSESLRIVCRHTAGIISDRMNLGPGELLVRLPNDGAAELTLLREAQQDLTVAIDGSRTEREIPEALAELLRTLTAASTIRRLTFNSFKDLHAFQLAVTGFDVKFDGIASTFSISRRRMVVPIYKQWTANTIRLQIVEQDNIIQLLAFFEDFSHADAMNFQLRTMDVFEKSDKGGKFGLKLVDAKFALPVEERRGEGKMQKEEGRLTGWSGTKRRFVCLDEIEYPGEHDDILIQFESAETRDQFAIALPAATMERKFTVRRKI